MMVCTVSVSFAICTTGTGYEINRIVVLQDVFLVRKGSQPTTMQLPWDVFSGEKL
jgi:hypothetical protein